MSRNAERRAHRVRALDALAERVERATSVLHQLHARGGNWPMQVKIRATLFTAHPYSEPPISRISAPRGVNLQIYLLALFEAQSRKRSGMVGPCPLPISGSEISWVDLIVSEAKENMQAKAPVTARQNRVRQVKSSIKRLADEGLILRNVGDPDSPFPLMLLHEYDAYGSEKRDYVVPESYEGPPTVVTLSSHFFTNGWVYLLTDAEIRIYLILKHLAGRFPDVHRTRGIYCTDRDRGQLYKISRDTYEAHLTLAKFGLIEKVENPLRHGDGKVVDFERVMRIQGVVAPHRFRVLPDFNLLESPRGKVRRALINYPPSYRQMTSKGAQFNAL
ncbi:hypothetical protein ACIBCM_33240 [Streptomyces sp. NPDC051018]|uniref:hypothetical protein n=1 Tax=Streptomyces sp. NPDC051018 TaxID=3365639 RepID=UPI00378AC3CE